MAKIAETFYPLTSTVWKNSSAWPPSCKRQKKAAGESWLLHFRWFRKEIPGMLLAFLLLFRALPLSPWFIHAPPGAGKSTCLVLTGFAGCSREVGIVFFLLLYHIDAVLSQHLHAPNHPFFMHSLHVHSSGVSVIASKCYDTTSSTSYIVGHWKVAFNCLPLNLDWLWWLIWIGECVRSDFLQLLRLSHKGLVSSAQIPFLSGKQAATLRSPHPWRDHTGPSGLCRHSGQQPELSIWLTTSILLLHKCHPSSGARRVSEEATLYVDILYQSVSHRQSTQVSSF